LDCAVGEIHQNQRKTIKATMPMITAITMPVKVLRVLPHFGHFEALELIVPPHSLQFISAIGYLSAFGF